MEINPRGPRPPRTHFFAGRHVRGWIVIGSLLCAVGFVANGIIFTIETKEVGDPRNGIDWSIVVGVLGSLSIAGIAWSVRISDAILKALERLFGRHMTKVDKKSPPRQPSQFAPPKTDEFKNKRIRSKEENKG